MPCQKNPQIQHTAQKVMVYPSFCKNPKVYATPGKMEAIFCQWIIDKRQDFLGLI
jgi:hypothetical protein